MQTSLGCLNRTGQAISYLSQQVVCCRHKPTSHLYPSNLPATVIGRGIGTRTATTATTTFATLLSASIFLYHPERVRLPVAFPPSAMNRKRAAPASAVTPVATASASKKRKTDNLPKFYAVQVGFRPGVYTSYAECAQQTAGFKGALCKWDASLFATLLSTRRDVSAHLAGVQLHR